MDQPALPPPPPSDASRAEPPLPPPPPVPHGGLYLDSVHLANTLRALRAKAQTRGDNATLAMRLAAIQILIWGLYTVFMMSMMTIGFLAEPTLYGPQMIGLGLAVTFGMLLILYPVAVLFTAGKVLPYHYQLAWYRLLNESDSILLADEERLRILQDNLPGKFWGSAVVKHQFSTLAERLEFAAFHLPSLRILAEQPEQPPRALMRQTEVARQYAKHFDSQGTVIGCCIVGGIISYAQIIYVAVALVQGPKVAQAASRLAAFIDFYLEEPRLDVTRVPPPSIERGWWSRTTAPWYYRGG